MTKNGINTTNLSSIEQDEKEVTQHAENVHDTRSICFINVKQIRNAEAFGKLDNWSEGRFVLTSLTSLDRTFDVYRSCIVRLILIELYLTSRSKQRVN